MTQYIDKSALVAEIKRLLDRYVSVLTFNYRATKDLNHLLSFIDTLEVKDVDLEKEIDDWYNIIGIPVTSDSLKETARHFFELGLKAAQKGE